MFADNPKHHDQGKTEFEYSPHKSAYEPEAYSPVQDTSRSQLPGSWVDPPSQPKFSNPPPSPPLAENTSGTAEIPPQTTEIPPRTTEIPPRTTDIPPRTTDIPPRTTNPPKPSEPIRLTAHEPAPFVPKGTKQQEWDNVLGNWSLRDDKESQFLDVVDAIRDHDLDRQLSLPQLVVCGKQSSGKSSVLEAITRVPFPRGDTTCTRFVTEYVSRIKLPHASLTCF